MERFYVVCDNLEVGEGAYILAEVVRDSETDRNFSLAATLAGTHSHVLTRSELLATVDGTLALKHWEDQDDDVFERETGFLSQFSRGCGTTSLRLVDSEERRRDPSVVDG